jgi:GH24 family phage-related lysozyme (muramidase)
MPEKATKRNDRAKIVRDAKAEAYQDAAGIARTTVGDGATETELAVATAISDAIEERANIVWGV